MVGVKSVKIDGENIHVFNSLIYIFEAGSGFTLELDLIVSEVVVNKYKQEDTCIVEIELEDERILSSIMNVKILPGKLPQMNIYTEIDDPGEYSGIQRITENDASFPSLEEGITIEEIRKVEMPNKKIHLKLDLPIDQVEWLGKKQPHELNDIFQTLIYHYWNK